MHKQETQRLYLISQAFQLTKLLTEYRMIKKMVILVTLFCLYGCAAPRYTGGPADFHDATQTYEVVVINNEETKRGFLETIEKWLTENNYVYSVVPNGSKHDLTKLTLEYRGSWNWDMAIYLANANIGAFFGGQRVGEVNYVAPNTLNGNKFSDAEERVQIMMDILFGKIGAEDATKKINAPATSR